MIYKLIMLSEKQQKWEIWLSAINLTRSKSMGTLDYIKCRYSKTAFWKKLKLGMQGYLVNIPILSFSSKSEHDTVTDQATLIDMVRQGLMISKTNNIIRTV